MMVTNDGIHNLDQTSKKKRSSIQVEHIQRFAPLQLQAKKKRRRGNAGQMYPIEEGTAVEARCHGGWRWYPGTVNNIQADPDGEELYDVTFDDGARDSAVSHKNIRPRSPPTNSLDVDSKMEASCVQKAMPGQEENSVDQQRQHDANHEGCTDPTVAALLPMARSPLSSPSAPSAPSAPLSLVLPPADGAYKKQSTVNANTTKRNKKPHAKAVPKPKSNPVAKPSVRRLSPGNSMVGVEILKWFGATQYRGTVVEYNR
jgi:hypothetical protein